MKHVINQFIIIFIAFSSNCNSQNNYNLNPDLVFRSELIRDSIFENVIEIADEPIFSNGKDFLIDISIPKNIELPVIFLKGKLPMEVLPTLYPEYSRLVVIIPNWSNYTIFDNRAVPQSINDTEQINIIYEFNRENKNILKDSLLFKGSLPEIKFLKNRISDANQIKVFYTEKFGSTCCPKDLQWDIKPNRNEFIELFQNENNCKIIDTYKKINGKEGESIYYYTLRGLSNDHKLKFIKERDFSRFIDRQNNQIRVYTPIVIEINGNMSRL